MQKDCLVRKKKKLLWARITAHKFMLLLGRNTPGTHSLGWVMHMLAPSVGSQLPAYSCKHKHIHTTDSI